MFVLFLFHDLGFRSILLDALLPLELITQDVLPIIAKNVLLGLLALDGRLLDSVFEELGRIRVFTELVDQCQTVEPGWYEYLVFRIDLGFALELIIIESMQ